jgi:alanine-glyoxylate transaminase/serine-glyoxylate transaminase/serine-pyruvate transaminase
MVMADLGLKIELGSGVAAAQAHYRSSRAPQQKAAA